MSSIQNHFTASQPEGLVSKRRSYAEAAIVPRRSMVIDHFMLYVLNNIQLPPNVLEQARLSLKSATSGLNECLNNNTSVVANYKPNSVEGPTEGSLTTIRSHLGKDYA